MQIDLTDVRSTIVPKSDQLNADQLVGGPRVIHITSVTGGGSAEQPITIHYDGEEGRPYKPCLTMRKVLVCGLGHDATRWPGNSLTLYHDADVLWAGVKVGGIRISHMTGIEKDIIVSLAQSKSKKALHTIKRMEAGPRLADVLQAIQAATDKASMDAAKKMAKALTSDADISAALAAYQARVQVLKTGAAIGAEPGFGDLAH